MHYRRRAPQLHAAPLGLNLPPVTFPSFSFHLFPSLALSTQHSAPSTQEIWMHHSSYSARKLLGQELLSPPSSHDTCHIPVILGLVQLTHFIPSPQPRQPLTTKYFLLLEKTLPTVHKGHQHRGVHRIVPHDAKCLPFLSRVSIENRKTFQKKFFFVGATFSAMLNRSPLSRGL